MVDVVKLITVNGEEFTVPNGVTSLRADLIGPGGPSTSTTGGRAGGGGGGAIGVIIAVTPGEVFRAVLGNSIGGGAGFTDFSFTQGDRSATAGGGAPAPTSSSTVGGNGGVSSYSNVTLLYAYTGGKGGTGASTGGGGGGGAAGPNGNGGAGGAGNGTSRNSGGGGGANGGTAGASGPASTTAFAAGGVGANGGGNGGRGDNQATGGAVAGSPGTIFTDTTTGQTAGPGGGGGGNRNTAGTGAVPGGQYGGGAGGGGASPTSVPGDGIVILTYTVAATLSAGRASVAVAGTAANLVRGFTLPAAKSAFVAVGVAAGIKRSCLFSVAPGTLRAQGTGAGLLAGHVLPAAGVQLSTNARDGTLRAARRFDAGIAPLAFAGGAAILTRIGRRVLDARSAVIVAVGTSAKLLRTRLIYGEAAAFLWDGVATALAIVRAVTIVAPADRVVRPAARQRLVRSAPRVRVIKITRSPAMLNWPSMHVGEVSDVGIDWTSALETGDTVASATASFSTDAVAGKAESRDGAVHSLRLNAVRSGTVIVVVTAVTTLGETLKDTIRLAVAP